MRISDWSSDVCSSDLSSALRKIGAVPVLGLTAAKSSAPSSITRVARRRSLAPASSGSTGGASSATACRKNAQRADLTRRDGPPNPSAQNLKLAWMSGQKTFLFSKSKKAQPRPVVALLRKNGDAPLSGANPDG